MGALWRMVQALWLGAKLRKSATWKDAGAFAAVAAPLLTLIAQYAAEQGWLPGEVSAEEIDALALWIWQGSGVVLAYWFRATSADVGWGRQQEIETHPEDVYDSDPYAGGGVLHRLPGVRVQPDSPAHIHPGDDPGPDGFNR